MISERELTFKDRLHLERTFTDRVGSNASGKQVAVMGGHFMLLYDESMDCLVPMIWQDAKNDRVRKLSRSLAGDFPVQSMEMSLSLTRLARGCSATPRIVLLVNDHKFTDRTFDSEFADSVAGRAEGLRKDFFRHNPDLPQSLDTLVRHESTPLTELFLANDDSRRDKNAILPRRTIFFSEMALRNRFNHQSRQYIKGNPRFRLHRRTNACGLDGGCYEVYYHDGIHQEECLTNEGECGCAGEMVEFFLQLQDRGFAMAVVLTPHECKKPVRVAGRIAANLMAERRPSPGSLWIVTGLGGCGDLPGEDSHEPLTALEIAWPAH